METVGKGLRSQLSGKALLVKSFGLPLVFVSARAKMFRFSWDLRPETLKFGFNEN